MSIVQIIHVPVVKNANVPAMLAVDIEDVVREPYATSLWLLSTWHAHPARLRLSSPVYRTIRTCQSRLGDFC